MEPSLRILLVDDEEDFLEATSRRLRRRGFEVKTATRCEEALRAVEERWPGVVVLGYLLIHTRQIDMVMDEQAAVDRCRARIDADIRMIRERFAAQG